jgi:hypothetical protein
MSVKLPKNIFYAVYAWRHLIVVIKQSKSVPLQAMLALWGEEV